MKEVEVQYRLYIETDSYAGNYERELCAFLTGHIGECEVGQEYVEEEIYKKFEGMIVQRPDDRGCWRPVEICDENNHNIIIYLEREMNQSSVEFIRERAKLFKKGKVLSIVQQKIVVNIRIATVEEI